MEQRAQKEQKLEEQGEMLTGWYIQKLEEAVVLMMILGIKQGMSHYLHFTNNKTKIQLSGLLKASQVSSGAETQPKSPASKSWAADIIPVSVVILYFQWS